MDIRILIGLIAPFFKEALFGRNIDPDTNNRAEKSISQRIIDFFMKSHRATSFLIILVSTSLFINVIAIKKISAIAITKESKDKQPKNKELLKKPTDTSSGTVEVDGDSLEVSRKRIMDRIGNRDPV